MSFPVQRPLWGAIARCSRSFSSLTPNAEAPATKGALLNLKTSPAVPSTTTVTAPTPAPSTLPQHYDVPPEKDPILQFLTTKLMKHGRYQRAQKMVSEMLLHIHTMTRSPPLPIVHEAILKASPAVRIRSYKIGARQVMKPYALSERQRTGLGIEWILNASDSKPGIQRQVRLAKEMIAVVRGESAALSKKQEMHRGAMVARGSLQGR